MASSLRELAKILSIDLKRFKLKEETVHDMKRLADMARAESSSQKAMTRWSLSWSVLKH